MELLYDALDLLATGGWVTIPLLFAASLLCYTAVYRWLVLHRPNAVSARQIVSQVRRQYQADDEERYDNLLELAAYHALTAKHKFPSDPKPHIDEAYAGLSIDLKTYSTVIHTIVMIAPLLGLLGTVIGMIETFESMGDMSLFSQSGGIAGGISQALITTQLGLIIAIPGLLFDRFLKRREELIHDEMQQIKEIISQN